MKQTKIIVHYHDIVSNLETIKAVFITQNLKSIVYFAKVKRRGFSQSKFFRSS